MDLKRASTDCKNRKNLLSGSKNNDPNESISWYIVEDGQYSVCLKGFNPIDADDFENDAAEEGTSFWLISHRARAQNSKRGARCG